MRRLLLLATLAATAASFAPAAHADPVACVRTINDKGVETKVCTPVDGGPTTHCVVFVPNDQGRPLLQFVEVCTVV
jgi:hypothetical protein